MRLKDGFQRYWTWKCSWTVCESSVSVNRDSRSWKRKIASAWRYLKAGNCGCAEIGFVLPILLPSREMQVMWKGVWNEWAGWRVGLSSWWEPIALIPFLKGWCLQIRIQLQTGSFQFSPWGRWGLNLNPTTYFFSQEPFLILSSPSGFREVIDVVIQ